MSVAESIRKRRCETRRKRRRKAENRAYAHAEKLRRGCEVTGAKLPPQFLEWHHLDPEKRRYWIARAYSRGTEGFRRELAECVCVSRRVHSAIHRGTIVVPKELWSRRRGQDGKEARSD